MPLMLGIGLRYDFDYFIFKHQQTTLVSFTKPFSPIKGVAPSGKFGPQSEYLF